MSGTFFDAMMSLEEERGGIRHKERGYRIQETGDSTVGQAATLRIDYCACFRRKNGGN